MLRQLCRSIHSTAHPHRTLDKNPLSRSVRNTRRYARSILYPTLTGRQTKLAAGIASGVTLGTVIFCYFNSDSVGSLWTSNNPLLLIGSRLDLEREDSGQPVESAQKMVGRGGGGGLPGAVGKVQELGTERIIEGLLWSNTGAYCPPESDFTGIARCDSTVVPVELPAAEYIATSIIALPTHSWVLFGIFDGENGSSMSQALSTHLPPAVVSYLVDMLLKYVPSMSDQAQASQIPDTADFNPFSDVSDPLEVAFTPDIIRPFPPEEVHRAIKSAFLAIDNLSVHESTALLLKITEMAEADGYNQANPPFRSKETAVQALKEPYTGANVLAGLYESDSRLFRFALTGDSRAVLGRPVNNPSYKPSSSSSPLSPTSKSSTPSKNAWWKSGPTPASIPDRPLEPRPLSEYSTLYTAQPLTAEQTPSNPKELARIKAQHPDTYHHLIGRASNDVDPNATPSYMGIKTTRGFGYGSLKWTLDLQERLHQDFLGDAPPAFFVDGSIPPPPSPSTSDVSLISRLLEHASTSLNLSASSLEAAQGQSRPPYLTAEPEITSIKVQPGDFVVMASKGLFQCLTNEEVVGLVGVWLEERKRMKDMGARDGKHLSTSAKDVGETRPSLRDPRYRKMRNGGSAEGESMEGVEVSDKLQASFQARPATEPSVRAYSRLVKPSELPIAASSPSSSSSSSCPTQDGWRWERSWRISKAQKPDFMFDGKDMDCASVHIVRNAFGGADRDLRGALLSMDPPRAGKFRDDVSVQVIFFE